MKYTQLTEGERYQIYRLLKEGFTQKAIAYNYERHPSSISRKLKRNKGLRGYRHKQANKLAVEPRCSAKKSIKLTYKCNAG